MKIILLAGILLMSTLFGIRVFAAQEIELKQGRKYRVPSYMTVEQDVVHSLINSC